MSTLSFGCVDLQCVFHQARKKKVMHRTNGTLKYFWPFQEFIDMTINKEIPYSDFCEIG